MHATNTCIHTCARHAPSKCSWMYMYCTTREYTCSTMHVSQYTHDMCHVHMYISQYTYTQHAHPCIYIGPIPCPYHHCAFSYKCVSSGPVAPCVWLLAWPNLCVRLALHNIHGFGAHMESQSAHCQCSMWNVHLPVCKRAAVTLSPPYTRLGTPTRPRGSQDVELGLSSGVQG